MDVNCSWTGERKHTTGYLKLFSNCWIIAIIPLRVRQAHIQKSQYEVMIMCWNSKNYILVKDCTTWFGENSLVRPHCFLNRCLTQKSIENIGFLSLSLQALNCMRYVDIFCLYGHRAALRKPTLYELLCPYVMVRLMGSTPMHSLECLICMWEHKCCYVNICIE